ncbi:MAG: hypothetical protein IT537_08645 [Hyphomicrobiales bacterium]|nr:hypothetical protein [Hyphomicrobiales bacterium]
MDRPVIMSAPMVLAHLERRKRMTRRMLYTSRVIRDGRVPSSTELAQHPSPMSRTPHEYWTLSGWEKVKPGDRLWIRENISRMANGSWKYAADNKEISLFNHDPWVAEMVAWAHHEERESVPSIHMPKWASRITLLVEQTKIERLQDITEEDAKAEGVEPAIADQSLEGPLRRYRTGFVRLWGTLHGTESWIDNPWVVAISYRVLFANINTREAKAA